MNFRASGKNLQDHIDYVQTWRVPSNTETVGVSLRGTATVAGAMFEWKNKRSGLITTAYATAGAFFRSSPELRLPICNWCSSIAIVDDHARKLHLGHGISCHVDVLRPYSRGTVKLQSADARDAPVIDPQFLSDERDLQLLLKGGANPAAHHRIRSPSTGSAARCCIRPGSTTPPEWKRIFAPAPTPNITR